MNNLSTDSSLPVVVIGAGPIGLAAAAQLIRRGLTPLVLEADAQAGASVARWAHVRLFTPWRYLTDAAAVALLEETGWELPPADDLPTGAEFLAKYLLPLAGLPALAPHLRLGTRVVSIARQGFDKMKTPGRERAPFILRVETADGKEERLKARAVIDASGTYRTPNPLGGSGVAAEGEDEISSHLFYGIPDVLGRDRSRYAGRRVLVAGSGHSASTILLDLARLREQEPETQVSWVVRKENTRRLYGGGAKDDLPGRGALGTRVHALVDGGVIHLHTGFRVEKVAAAPHGGVAVSSDEGQTITVDEVIAATGFRPDLSFIGELRVALEPAVESPVALAPLIDPNEHSCGSVPPHGARELAHPEKDFYIVGMKSYGRAPTFLMMTGYEQVRSVACALAGDEAGANAVELVLPETGVCSLDVDADDGETSSCCSSGAPVPVSASCCTPEPAGANASSSCCG